MNTKTATAWNLAFDEARAEYTVRYQDAVAGTLRAAHTEIRLTLQSTQPGTMQEAGALGAATALAGLLSAREA